jgi:hypothetical protein
MGIVWKLLADIRLLQVRHVAIDAATTRRADRMIGVRVDQHALFIKPRARRRHFPSFVAQLRAQDLDFGSLAGMTIQALSIAEATDQRLPPDVSITLTVRIVAIHAGHRPVQIAVAVEMLLLIGEHADTTIREVRAIAEQKHQIAEVVLQRFARYVTRLQLGLDRVALEADLERSVLVEGGQGLDADVCDGIDRIGIRDLDVSAARS